jgi:hypothetical protein
MPEALSVCTSLEGLAANLPGRDRTSRWQLCEEAALLYRVYGRGVPARICIRRPVSNARRGARALGEHFLDSVIPQNLKRSVKAMYGLASKLGVILGGAL